MIKLSPRLKAISEFVSDDSSIVDVGCDHAYLSIYLFQHKKNVEVIASDINKNALNIAKRNIEKNNLEDKIKLVLSDGLKNVDLSNINTIIISGMGGINITKILEKKNLNNINHIIIQANTDIFLVRKNITNLNYYISDEKLVLDNNKYYTVISFKKGHKKYNLKQLHLGPILLLKKDEIFLNKCQSDYKKLKQIYKNIPWTKILKKISFYLYMNLYKL